MFLKRFLFSVLIIVLFGSFLSAADTGFDLEELQAAGTESKSFLEILFKSAIDKSTEEAEQLEEKLREAEEIHEIITPEPVIVPEAEPEQPAEASTQPVSQITILKPDMEVKSTVREVAVFYVEGEGWTLEDYSDSDGAPTSRLKYTGREYLNGKTAFSFYPYSIGEYIIIIRKTDYSAGIIERMKYILTVESTLSDVTVDATVEAEAAVTDATEVYTEAAGQSVEMPANDSIDTVLTTVEDLILPDSGSEAVKTANGFTEVDDYTGAIHFLERCLKKPEITERDTVLFKLAGLYEISPELRDERTAAGLYRQIVDYYPVSIYWTQSKEKIIYLERTFLYIR